MQLMKCKKKNDLYIEHLLISKKDLSAILP